MKKLTSENLEDLAIGSAILGSGGGGDPHYPHMSARYRVEQCGLVSMISVSELKPDTLVMPIGFMGTSLVEMEKLPSGREFKVMFEQAENALEKKIEAVMPFQVGGGNAFIPISVAAQLNLPIVDADTLGRAFPETQMNSCNLFMGPNCRGFATDCLGNTAEICASNARILEKISRQITVAMGSNNAFAMYPLTGEQARATTLHKALSKAITLGKVHREAKKKGKDPLEAILAVGKGVCLGTGKIVDVDKNVLKSFLHGTVVIESPQGTISVAFQNEYLLAKINDNVVATTPDILMLLEKETGQPITSELLHFGLKVNLIALPAPSIWTTSKGLALVGPRYFGYEIDYQPITRSK